MPILSHVLPSNSDHLQRAVDLVERTGKRNVGPLRRVDQAAQVLGQAGAAEGEAGSQVGGADEEEQQRAQIATLLGQQQDG